MCLVMYAEVCDTEDWLTADHENHDYKWVCTSRSTRTSVCVACCIQQLEDPSSLCVRKQLLLTRLLENLHCPGGEVVAVLGEDTRVAAHAATVLLGEKLLIIQCTL